MRNLLVICFVGACQTLAAADPLPSWNEGPARDAIVNFVTCATTDGCPGFVPPEERIAVFDNDGCLWSEQPAYFQLLFAIDRVKALAKDHPEWKTTQPFQAVLENDKAALAKSGMEGVMKIVAATHAGMTTDEFAAIAKEWLTTAKHPRFDRPYTECVYQPMLELLAYLRANGFQTYIVSGGGVDFIRVFAEEVYGIPPQQVIGTAIETKYELRDGEPVLVRQPKIAFVDDKEGKAIAIQRIIGRRPVAAFGNSDGDLQMLQWTTVGRTPSFGLIVHHTDAKREYAYDRESHVGRLDKALDEAAERNWTVVDMQRDWKTIHPKR